MTSSPFRRIDQQLFAQVSAEAQQHPRLRLNHNFHREQDSVQRFLNGFPQEGTTEAARQESQWRDLLSGSGLT